MSPACGSPAPGSRARFGPGTAAACAEQPPPSVSAGKVNASRCSGPSVAGNREAGGSRDPVAMITCVSWGRAGRCISLGAMRPALSGAA